ncbi:MAG: hypothetical protein ABI779_20870 [Acidobacteriota bacterium]
MTAALALLVGSSAFAQERSYPRTNGQTSNRQANRMVEGTVASVVHARNGERVRLTNGMDLLVPNSVTGVRQGRRYGAATLQVGDVVRMSVYSQDGDGRDARVRSLEILQSRSWNNNNDRRFNGTVVSFDRRGRSLVMNTDHGRTVTVDLSTYSSARGNSSTPFRRGDRISVAGRMDRGTVLAEDIRLTR